MRFIYLIERTHQAWHRGYDDEWEPETPTLDILADDCYLTESDALRACADLYDTANKVMWNRQAKAGSVYNPAKDYCNLKYKPVKVPVKRFQISEHP